MYRPPGSSADALSTPPALSCLLESVFSNSDQRRAATEWRGRDLARIDTNHTVDRYMPITIGDEIPVSGLSGAYPGAVRWRACVPIDTACTAPDAFPASERFRGLLAPLIMRGRIAEATRKGFIAMNNALKQRAESAGL
jgi:hypothetical protein